MKTVIAKRLLVKKLPWRHDCCPCPFCGNKRLWVGNISFSQVGVECWNCGVTLAVDLFEKLSKKESMMSREDLANVIVFRAIRLWNRRAKI